jgi:hypothetical protein
MNLNLAEMLSPRSAAALVRNEDLFYSPRI